MLNSLPKDIIKYLVNELPPFTGILILKIDTEGNIIDFHGPHKEYLRNMPEIGKPIHEYVPALYSMIPPLISPMILNKIKSNNTVYADIHIVATEQDEHWVFFVDQNREVESIRHIIQSINEEKLREETNKDNSKDVNYSPFAVFDYLNIKIDKNNKATINSSLPQWFKLVTNKYSVKDKIVISEIFPYFEVFNLEADEFWAKKENGKIKSGVWTETLTNGQNIVLSAYAIYFNETRYILIQQEEEIAKDQLALQLARDQKLAYEKLEKTERKLKTLLDYKDKFVSIVSHDLRSPVAAVLGIADMLVNDKKELSKLDEFYIEMIHSIKDEMIRLLDYNDKLYHWSNLELGNFEVVKEKTSLKKIIEIAHRTADKRLKSKNINFSTNLNKDIEMEVDMTLFLQVLNNLLANAIKFTPENGNISINVTEGNDLQIAVVDSGVGIPKEVSENIFSGYTRDSSLGTDGEKGTGLGLGIVKKIIDAHGFTIDVKSEQGKGSKFILTIS